MMAARGVRGGCAARVGAVGDGVESGDVGGWLAGFGAVGDGAVGFIGWGGRS